MRFCTHTKKSFHLYDSWKCSFLHSDLYFIEIQITFSLAEVIKIFLSSGVLPLLLFLELLCYLFPFEYFNCGSVGCRREGRKRIYKVCHFALKGH